MRSPIEQREARRISPMALVRRSGLLAMAAGANMIVLPFVHPSDDVGVQSVAWVPVHLLYFAALTVILLALVGIFARQLQRARRLGVAGFLTAFVGTAMVLLEGREHLFSPDFGVGTPRGLPELIVASLVFSIGYILLGSAIVRAGVLPRGVGILLAVGGPIVAFSPRSELRRFSSSATRCSASVSCGWGMHSGPVPSTSSRLVNEGTPPHTPLKNHTASPMFSTRLSEDDSKLDL